MMCTNYPIYRTCLRCCFKNGVVPDTFPVIDLASAFNQLFLDEESSHLLTINTRII